MTKDDLRKELGIIGDLNLIKIRGEEYDTAFSISYFESEKPELIVRYFMEHEINELSLKQIKIDVFSLQEITSINDLLSKIKKEIIGFKIERFKLTRETN